MMAEIGVIYEKLAGSIRETPARYSDMHCSNNHCYYDPQVVHSIREKLLFFKANRTPSGKKKHDLMA